MRMLNPPVDVKSFPFVIVKVWEMISFTRLILARASAARCAVGSLIRFSRDTVSLR
jgi:hypothetical protein